MSENFAVRVGEFEGPMGLLLELVEKRKLAISEVSLAVVTEHFIAHLEQETPTRSPNELADFIVVASTLMLIKSRSLLPQLSLSEEEQSSISELEHRLKIYQRVKALGSHVAQRYEQAPLWRSGYQLALTPTFSPPTNLTPSFLAEVIRGLLGRLPKLTSLPSVAIKKVISLEEAMQRLTEWISRSLNLNFRDHVGSKTSKIEVVVTFLGLLELVKRGLVAVEQSAHLGDITVSEQQPGVPHYN